MQALREIVARLGVEVDDTPLKKLDGNLDKTVAKLKKIATGAAFLVGGKAALNFLETQIEIGTKIQVWADRLGFGTTELQKFEYAADQAGISSDQFTLGMKLLGKNIGEAAEGQAGATKRFSKLGIAFKDAEGHARPIPDVLLDIADRMQKAKSGPERLAIGMDTMGKSGAAMVPLLMQGRDAVQDLFDQFDKLGGGLSEKFIKESYGAGQAMKRLAQATKVWHSEIALGALPLLTRLADKLAQGAAQNVIFARKTTFAQTAWHAFIAVLIAGTLAVLPMLWSLLAPLVPWIALGLAAYIIYDDLFAMFTGKKSLIGGVMDAVFGEGKSTMLVNQLKAAWDEVTASIDALFPATERSGTGMQNFIRGATIAVAGLVKVLAGLLRLVVGVGEAALLIGDSITDMNPETARATWGRAGDSMKSTLGAVFGDKGLISDWSAFADSSASGGGVQLTPQAQATIANTHGTGQRFSEGSDGKMRPIEINVNNTIQGDMTPAASKQVAKGVKDATTQSLEQAAGAMGGH